MIGTQVGPFTIVCPLSEGGIDTVYLAEHAVLKTRRAVKLLSPQLAQDPQLVQRFVDEAREAAGLHPGNRIEVHDVGQLPSGAWFMVLDYRHDHPLARFMAQRVGAAPGLPGLRDRIDSSSRYQLGHKLGAGGMAEVFAGTMMGVEGFARPVAIKRVLPGLSQVPAFATMFVAEARIASRLAHCNIVSVLDFSRDPEGRLFLVMEYVDGVDLASLLDAGPIAPSLAIFIAVEMLRGLGYAHDLPDPATGLRGVIHRDVSPQNLLLSHEGAVKVSDFGLAKARAASALAWSDTVRGKPGYMSPEQCAGEPLDGRSDLYSVGVMLWEMLAHRSLFTGTSNEILAQVMFKDVATPSSVRRSPADLEAIAMKLLARNRSDRYATAEAAIEALLRCSDAPRDGRGELVGALAGRFPRAAGSRPLRSRRHLGAGAGTHGERRPHRPCAVPAERITVAEPASASAPSATLSGAASQMVRLVPGAHLAARPWGRPRRGMLAATISGVMLGCLATAAVIARGDTAPSTGRSISLPMPAALPIPAAIPIPAPIPAALPREVPAAPPVSTRAAPVAALAPEHRERPPRVNRTGELAIIVRPWAMIWLNGKPSGQTPFRGPVPAGRYRVRLANDDLGQTEVTTITVEPDQTATVERTW